MQRDVSTGCGALDELGREPISNIAMHVPSTRETRGASNPSNKSGFLPRCVSLYLCYALWTALLTSVHSLPVPILEQKCPDYAHWATQRNGKELSEGRYQLPFQRPSEECRTFYSQEVEDAIERLRPKIVDSELFRLFENAFPNTLDTAVKWKGFAWKDGKEGEATDEDLAFVITGDMCAISSPPRSQTDSVLEMQCGCVIRQIKSCPTYQSSKHRMIQIRWPRSFAA